MKILIGVCLSKKNFRYLNLFINDINKIIVPENSYLKIFFIVNKKDYYFKYLIKKKLSRKKCDYKILFAIFYLLASLLPILPTGSIFSSSNGSLFWIIFSLTNYRSFNLDSFFNKTK